MNNHITSQRYRCPMCSYTDTYYMFHAAKNLSQRLIAGMPVTDVQCPKTLCGALAYPIPRYRPAIKRKATTRYVFTFRVQALKGTILRVQYATGKTLATARSNARSVLADAGVNILSVVEGRLA